MKKGIISLLILVLMFASCKKEDNISPVINSINLSSNDTIRNTFVIRVDASDNKSIDRVEYYVNDSLITKINIPPYDYQLNTLNMKDGPGTMRVVVYDPEGNKMESSRSFLVQNVLLSLKMGSLYSVPYHIVVSDEKGNILNTATYHSNETKKIMPLKECEVKSLNIVYYFTSSDYTFLTAYIHVKRGSELKTDLNYDPGTSKVVTLHLKNDIASFSRIDVTSDKTSTPLVSLADTVNIPASFPYSADHKLLLQLQTTEGKYYRFIPVNDAVNLSLNLSSINTPETKKSFAFPSSGQASYVTYGRSAASDVFNRYFISSGNKEYNADHIDIFYPAEYFTEYYTYLTYYDIATRRRYTSITSGAVPENFTFMAADAQITSSTPSGFKANFSGTFDYYFVQYRTPSLYYSLSVTAPADVKEWVLPDLSTAFGNSEFSFNNFVLNDISLYDFESLNLAGNYYDLSLNIEQLSATDRHIQSLTIPMILTGKSQ